MKILMVTSYYLPNVSGITVYIKNLATELVKDGYQITILTSKHIPTLKKEEENNGIYIKRLWTPIKIGKGLIMPFFPILVVKEIKNTDVINCHLPSIESFWVAFWNLFFKKKLIVTYHCDFDSGNKFLNKLINFIQDFSLKKADVIVVNTKDYIENYRLLKKYQDKIREIYPPVLLEKIATKDQLEINEKIKILKNKKIIGFLGRISKEKNLELLIKTIPLIKKNKIDFTILMAGPKKVLGENKYQEKIEKLLEINENNILRLGEINNVGPFLKKCDCLVVPSNNKLESFGLVQLEAIKNGTPCVTSNLPGVRVVVLQTKMGEIFEKNNVDDLARKIIEVLKNGKNFYRNRAENLESFDYKKSVKEYKKIFNFS